MEGVAIGQRDRVKEAEDNLRSAAHNWRRALRFDAAKRAEQRAQEVALKCQHTIRKDGPRKVRERQRLVLGSTTIPRHTVPSRLQANHLSGLSAWRAAGAFTIVIEDQLSASIAGAIFSVIVAHKCLSERHSAFLNNSSPGSCCAISG